MTIRRLATIFVLVAGTIGLGCTKDKPNITTPERTEQGASEVPVPLTPAAGTRSAYPFPHFTWKKHPAEFEDPASPISYEIQIASDGSFTSLVDEDTVWLSRYVHAEPFPTGTYHWRARAVPYGKSPGAWSAPAVLTITPSDEELTVEVEPGTLDLEAVQKAVARAKGLADRGRSVKVTFPPGDYRIGESFVGPLIALEGTSGIVIDGTGARLHFASRKQGLIRAVNCQNVAVMGFSSSFKKGSLRIQGFVRAVDEENREVTVSIEPGFPDFRASDSPGGDIFYLLEANTEGRLKTATPNFFRADGGDFIRNADDTWTFSINRPVEPWAVGDRFCYNFRGGSVQLVDFGQSRSVTAYGLASRGWGNMQFVSVEGSLFNILHCTTEFDEGEWMTGNADGVHIRGHRVGPWIEGLKIQAIGDDSVALYARPASIKAVSPDSPNTAILKREFFNLEAGDEVSFFQPQGGVILLETTVKSVRAAKDGFAVSFADPLPSPLKLDGPLPEVTQIWNRSKSCGDFVVRYSEFKNIRRFGTVFRSRRGVVENNTYSGTSSQAILFENEPHYPNGLYASEIIIRNNTIDDCAFDGRHQGVPIAFTFNGYQSKASTIGPRNILIEGNVIADCHSPEISLTGAENVVLRGNNVRRDDGRFVPATFEADEHSESTVFQESSGMKKMGQDQEDRPWHETSLRPVYRVLPASCLVDQGSGQVPVTGYATPDLQRGASRRQSPACAALGPGFRSWTGFLAGPGLFLFRSSHLWPDDAKGKPATRATFVFSGSTADRPGQPDTVTSRKTRMWQSPPSPSRRRAERPTGRGIRLHSSPIAPRLNLGEVQRTKWLGGSRVKPPGRSTRDGQARLAARWRSIKRGRRATRPPQIAPMARSKARSA